MSSPSHDPSRSSRATCAPSGLRDSRKRKLRFFFALFTSVFALIASATLSVAQTTRPGTLVVVSDPNNLPFSNAKEEGFENKLAHLITRDLDLKLEYHWRATRRGYWR